MEYDSTVLEVYYKYKYKSCVFKIIQYKYKYK
jgi:hypothetical protein